MENSLSFALANNAFTILSPKLLTKTAVILFFALIFLWIASPAIVVAYLGLAIYAARGSKESIQAISLMAILLLLNPGMFSSPSSVTFLRWLVVFAAFGRVLFDNSHKPNQIVYPIIIFTFSTIILSVLTSHAPLISVLKVLIFGIGTYTIMSCFYHTLHLRDYWASWFFTLGFVVLVCSVPLYGTQWGYLRNGVGFQGLLNHPQVYGPFVAPFTAWTTCIFLFSKEKRPAIIICMIVAWAAIFTSQARTSFLMATGGTCLTILIGFIANQSWRSTIGRAFSVVRLIGFLILMLVVAVLYGPQIVNSFQEFAMKGEDSASYQAAFGDSRGSLVETQMNNFRDYPLTGIGFGVASDPEEFKAKTEGSKGIPTSASVEKGFMPSAVLEETGLTGALLVLLLLAALLKTVLKGGDISAVVILFTSLLPNVGEMVFFSLGGVGLFFWIMMGFAINQAMSTSQNITSIEHSPIPQTTSAILRNPS